MCHGGVKLTRTLELTIVHGMRGKVLFRLHIKAVISFTYQIQGHLHINPTMVTDPSGLSYVEVGKCGKLEGGGYVEAMVGFEFWNQ